MDMLRDAFRDLAERRWFDDDSDLPEPLNHAGFETEIPADIVPPAIGQDERRMQVRAYNHWADLIGNRRFPDIADIDPLLESEFGSHAILLDFSGGIDDPLVRHLGSALADECGQNGNRYIGQLSDVPVGSLLSRITDHYIQILARQSPMGFEAEFVDRAGKLIVYRGILLPFSSDDQTINHIFGVLNWKEVAETPLNRSLSEELGKSAAHGCPAARRSEDLPAPLSRRLRAMTAKGFDDVATDGPEFTLLMARRMTSGNVVLLGEVPFDAALLRHATDRMTDR